MLAIHQFSPSALSGDGIGNGMFYLQRILRSLGFISNIYAEDLEDSLKDRVFSYNRITMFDKESDTTKFTNLILWIQLVDKLEWQSWFPNIYLQKVFQKGPFF